MIDTNRHSLRREVSPFKQAMRFKLTDHLLVRACVDKEDKDKLHGLIGPPPKGTVYGPTILPTWAHKVVERRCVKPFQVGRYTNHTLSDHLFSFGLRMIGFLGSWGVPVFCSTLGLVAGLAFLPLRIFTATQVTLIQILIPVLLGALFVGKQLINLALYVLKLFGGEAKDEHGDIDIKSSFDMLDVTRNILPPYFRWNLNLAGCAFWLTVLFSSIAGEFMATRESKDDRDYVYRSQYMPLKERLAWLHRFSRFVPDPFRLPDESLAWADQDYRLDGYKLTNSEAPSVLKVQAESAFLRGGEKVTLTYKPETARTVLSVIFQIGERRTYQSTPFKLEKTANVLSSKPIEAVAIVHAGGDHSPEIDHTGGKLFVRPSATSEEPHVVFSANGLDGATNTAEYAMGLDTPLPIRIELRNGSEPHASITFDRVSAGYLISRLEQPQNYARDWFRFLFGVILTFGLIPRIIALPIFGVLYATSKWRLYREFTREPFASIIDDLNKRSTGSIKVDDKPFYNDPVSPNHSKQERLIPHRDVLAVGYNTRISDADVRRLGGVSGFSRFDRPAGDANTNKEVFDWLDKHESFGRFLVCCKLTATPDRPLINFLHKAVSKRFACELAFVDMPKNATATDDKTATRTEVWRNTMEDAGLLDLLPANIRNSGTIQGES